MKAGRTRAGFTSSYGLELPPIEHDVWTLADTRRLIGVLASGLLLAVFVIGAMAVVS